jgi:Fe-S-cluster containining protein
MWPMASPTSLFKCGRCPAYCCSYPIIEVSKKDLRRLAAYFNMSVKQEAKKFSEKASGRKKRVIRHRNDEHFGSVCRFLNRKTRACSIYAVRPKICSDFPGTRRCGYYDFLTFERRLLKDSDHVAVTDHP